MTDSFVAQSAIDQLKSAAHELVLDGESYRQPEPTVTDALGDAPPRDDPLVAGPDRTPKWRHATLRTGDPVKLAANIDG